jgi:hypothetical protein
MTGDLMNCQDVRVVESGGRLHFLDKSLQALRIGGQVFREDLDRDGAIEFAVSSAT